MHKSNLLCGFLLMPIGAGLIIGGLWGGWFFIRGGLMLTIVFGYAAVGYALWFGLMAFVVVLIGGLSVWAGIQLLWGKSS